MLFTQIKLCKVGRFRFICCKDVLKMKQHETAWNIPKYETTLHRPFLPRTIGTLQGPEQSLYQPSHPYHILRYTVFSNVSPLIHYSRHWRNLLQAGIRLFNFATFPASQSAEVPQSLIGITRVLTSDKVATVGFI